MAIISGSAMGQFKNKFLNAVTQKWNGLNVARGYQPDVFNPNTNKQQLVRARFSAAIKLAKALRATLKLSMLSLARSLHSTMYGTFCSINWDAINASQPDDVTIDYSAMKVSKGGLQGVESDTIDWGAQEHLTVKATFADNTGVGDADANDEVFLVLYQPELEQSVVSSSSTRSTGSVGVVLPNAWNGMTAHAYLFCVGQGVNTAGMVSDSMYVGNGEVA